jgi:hypothetical protein
MHVHPTAVEVVVLLGKAGTPRGPRPVMKVPSASLAACNAGLGRFLTAEPFADRGTDLGLLARIKLAAVTGSEVNGTSRPTTAIANRVSVITLMLPLSGALCNAAA